MNWALYGILSTQNTSIYIAPALQLSAVKNEFPSEGLRVFNEEHPAGK